MRIIHAGRGTLNASFAIRYKSGLVLLGIDEDQEAVGPIGAGVLEV
jgi:hypothetical protein